MFINKIKNMILYIIGNGFDLYHHLPSAYSDFQYFIKE